MNERGLEKTALIIFLIHHISMFVGAIHYDFASWTIAVILLTGLASIIIVAGKSWQYNTRVLFMSIMTNLSLIMYGSQSNSMFMFLLPFLGITVVVGLFGIPKLMIIPAISISFLLLFHRFSIKSFSIQNIDEVYSYFMPIINIYFIIYILYFWNIKRNESSRKMDDVIENLKEAERGKDDFIANVSHEIRTPVNNVVGMSEIILREDLPSNIKEDVVSIQTSGKHLVSVVSDILDFSELQSGKMKLVDEEYNPAAAIRAVIDFAEARKGNKDIEVLYQCDGTLPCKLVGDQQKLVRLISNLMDNAIKFTNDGCVLLKIGYRPESYGINLIITVSDTGIGMNEKEIEKLYTSYNQVDSKRSRQEGGIGLGMAITRRIVELMGGVISVSSEKKLGTEVRVVIPQKVASEEPSIKPFENTLQMLSFFDEDQVDNLKIRESYRRVLSEIAKDMNISLHQSHNLAELKRRCERDTSAIVFSGPFEYLRDKEVFDEISKTNKIVLIMDESQDNLIDNDSIVRLYKPFYIGNFAELVNPDNVYKDRKFVAPEAKILIVDDNIINLKVITGLLAPYNMQITTSTSGADALEKVDKNQYDLIFMDHMMPEMDGIETLKRIRNKTGLYFREVPIIALTANAVAGAREMFLAEGFQEFISKPVEVGLLDKVIRYYIANKIVYSDVKETATVIDGAYAFDKSDATDKTLGDLDIKSGIDFCGSYENLIDVLKIHYDEGDENYKKIDGFYQAKDWKNYSILVHGLKSSMKSVGALTLSEKAKALEFASKDENEDFILNHHEDMMEEYTRILGILKAYFASDEEELSDDFSNMTEIYEEEFCDFIDRFESASYAWNEKEILKALEIIDNRYYKGEALSKLHEKLCNKVEMSDYLSALEYVKKWKDQIDRKA